MQKLIGLIPAAGKGTRARPYTELIPKSMLQINGRPNLERNICLMRDALDIDEIYIVVGYLGSVIKNYFKDGSHLNVTLHYIENTELDKGLAWSILLGGQHIKSPFCVILSDECYVGSNHDQLRLFPYHHAIATCTVMHVDDTKLITRNYSVETNESIVVRLIEKPQSIKNNMLGCGTFILNPDIIPLLRDSFAKSKTNYVEFITFIDGLCQASTVKYFQLEGTYVNINDRDSLNLAQYYERSHTFDDNEVSLLIYSEGTEQDIDFTIKRYSQHGDIDKIYVLVPHYNTIEDKIIQHGATVIRCPPRLKLYGEKLHYSLNHLPGDIYLFTEAAYTFPVRDVDKLLDYLKEADMVVGTRTSRQLIEQGSNMKGITRLANVVLAKFLELLWWHFEGRFTDVGCTFRAIWATSYKTIHEQLKANGPEFLAEMTIEILNNRKRIIEIPVNYYNRSEALNSRYRNIGTFFKILRLIIQKRILR
jgi:NDP-sugar pyrophosphorylase family protein